MRAGTQAKQNGMRVGSMGRAGSCAVGRGDEGVGRRF